MPLSKSPHRVRGSAFVPLIETRPRPEVFHMLHCIDALRIHISATLYDTNETTPRTQAHNAHYEKMEKISPGVKTLHVEHCLDRMREYAMCHADLTPSPLYTYDGFQGLIGKTGPRVCRKWEPIREWMDVRASWTEWLQRPKL